MLIKNGEQKLQEYADRAHRKQVYRINDRISCYAGYGHSNCIVIEGETSLILVDALDTDARAGRLKEMLEEKTKKPVRTLIFTHGHPDHRGGAAAFADTLEEIIAFAPAKPVLKYMERLSEVLNLRTTRQFGYHLTEEELITQGLGVREGRTCGDGEYAFLPPTTLYREEQVDRVIDGVHLQMISAAGETDDQIFVWLPEDEVLCCGDNYYACWPNLYAIRGSQYRDIAAWVDSLEQIMSYPAKILLPGHTAPLFGYDTIQEVLGDYKGAIESVLLQTLDCMNRGMTESETVEQVKLPEQYRNKPHLGEFYGTIAWSVRSVYHGYVGWFDGNPSNLYPLPDHQYAKHLIDLIGEQVLLEQIDRSLEQGEYQSAVQDADLLVQAGCQVDAAKSKKAKGLLELAKMTTSANARHYYMECAR